MFLFLFVSLPLVMPHRKTSIFKTKSKNPCPCALTMAQSPFFLSPVLLEDSNNSQLDSH